MDEQVKLALAKWPNVPHCYGWLGLDSRGAWRMRDQRAQDLGLLGSKIANATLRGFIDRNYQADEVGRYFFQNGPQRVYVELQSTPYIARSDPEHGWVLHTGQVMEQCDAVHMTKEGCLILKSAGIVAQIDDRDMAGAMASVYVNKKEPATDEQIVDWLDHAANHVALTFLFRGKNIPITLASLEVLAVTCSFVMHPQSV